MTTNQTHEGLKMKVRWEQLQLLSSDTRELIMGEFISDYLFTRQIELTRDEAIETINQNPLIAEVVEYGIHGLMVSIELMEGRTRVYWQVLKLKDFNPIIEYFSKKTELTTYGKYGENNSKTFEVPEQWLLKKIKELGYKDLEEFKDDYTWDTSEELLATAYREGVI